MGSAVSSVGGLVGDVASSFTPKIGTADQSKIDQARQAAMSQANANTLNQQQLQNLATTNFQGAQNLLTNAQNMNNYGDVSSALHLLQQQANGTAPSAAEAVLQQGKDQAIASQMAMANSGNLSQMIGGQKTAMDNAANLTQQAANQATQLRANQQALGQQQYANAAAQQVQNQTALGNAGTNLANTIQGGSNNLGQLASNNIGNAGNMGMGQTDLSQGVMTQNGQNVVKATGGLTNGLFAAGTALVSDERQKTNIKSDRTEFQKNWEDLIDSFTGEYSKKIKKKNETTDRVLDGYEKEDLMMSDEDSKDFIKSDRSARASGISSFFKNENKKPESKEESKPEDSKKSMESYGGEDPRKKAARQIKEGFMSDENSKKDIKKSSMLHRFLEKIEPVTYEYKDPTGEMGKTPGTHMGVIAQDVEKAPGGESMVIDTPEGKAIDMASAMGMLMSAAADAHGRMSSLEELFKSRKAK